MSQITLSTSWLLKASFQMISICFQRLLQRSGICIQSGSCKTDRYSTNYSNVAWFTGPCVPTHIPSECLQSFVLCANYETFHLWSISHRFIIALFGIVNCEFEWSKIDVYFILMIWLTFSSFIPSTCRLWRFPGTLLNVYFKVISLE